MTLLAWHGDPALKAEVMERLRQHRAADAFVQRVYQQLAPDLALGYRGCALGCTLPQQPRNSYGEITEPPAGWSVAVEQTYGIDRLVADLIDDLFESLDLAEAAQFAVEVVEAIPVGADLSLVETRYDGTSNPRPRWRAARFIEALAAAPVPTEVTS